MRKSVISVAMAAALGISGTSLPASAHVTVAQSDDVIITTTELGDGLYMLEGRGGNIGISVGPDGVFMIDDQFGNIADKILAAVAEVTDEPVSYVLNTHWHGDHTGGNAAMAAEGATILSHDNVRKRLKQSLEVKGELEDGKTSLPVLTFSDTTTFFWNDHEIHVFHFPNAHTDGDALVHFKTANAMHLGDTLFAGLYPFIDLDSGGTVAGYIANLEAVATLADDETKIIPGHGPLSDKATVLSTIEMLKDTRAAVKDLVDKGLSEDEIVASDPLAPWNDNFSWQFIDGERMTRTLVRDLTK
ncbi:MAG: MBL fold metallo-hydrolase [Aquisalinus sp.]|nr:MBL fold metallo-hydrolase [Aquisalinus sp.]